MGIEVNKNILSLDNEFCSFNCDLDKVFNVNGYVDTFLKKEFKRKVIYIVLASLMNEDRIVGIGYKDLSVKVALYSGNMINIPSESIKRLLIELQNENSIECIHKAKHRGEKTLYLVK